MRDRVRTVVYYAFRRRGITIPYPIQVEMQHEPVAPAADRGALERALGSAQIFTALSDAQRGELLQTATPSLYGAGDVIVREGEAGSSMFVIARGEAVVTLDKSTAPVARLHAGDFFGEMSLLTGDARTATVTAVTDCEVIEMTAAGFRAFVMAEPIVADLICAAVEKRRGELAERRATLDAAAPAGEPSRSLIARMRKFLRLTAT